MKKVYAFILILLMLCMAQFAFASTLNIPAGTTFIGEEAFFGIASDYVVIPDSVRHIEENAFAQSQVKLVKLPDNLTDIADHAFDDSVEFIVTNPSPAYHWVLEHKYAVADSGLKITEIRADQSSGLLAKSVTWTVETTDDSQVVSYSYSLLLDGTEISSKTDINSPTFTAAIKRAGEYQLLVTVKAADGSKASGSSPLYISEEIMSMTCPETLEAGEDLEITVHEVEGASRYIVFVMDADAGETLTMKTMTEPRTITINGYALDGKTYEIYGYVYGSRFRYAIPTVKTIQIHGMKFAGPSVSASLTGEEESSRRYKFEFNVEKYQNVVSRAKYSDFEDVETHGNGKTTEIWFWSHCDVSFSLLIDGKWTAWSDPYTVDIPERERLSVPEFSMEDSFLEGVDPAITLTSVENADYYNIDVFYGDQTANEYAEGEIAFSKQVRKSGEYTLDGFGAKVPAGDYTLQVYVWTSGDLYESNVAHKLIHVTDNPDRPEAPSVTADRTEAGVDSYFELMIDTTGGDAILPYVTATRPNGSTERWNYSISNANGANTGWGINRGEDYLGYVFHYSFAVRKNGVWSAFSDPIDIRIVERESLPQAVILVPENVRAGQDFTFSFEAVNNATYYYAHVYYEDEELSNFSFDNGPASVTLSGREILPGTYRIELHASDQNGYFADSISTATVTIEGSRPAGPTVTANSTSLPSGDKVQFTIDTSASDMIRVERTGYKEGKDAIHWGSSTITPWEEKTVWETTPGYGENVDSVVFVFYSCKDGIWSEATTVTIFVSEAVALDIPVIISEDAFNAGEDIQISIGQIENAEEYSCEIRNSAGTNVYSHWRSSNREITIEGYRLNPGTYTLYVWAHAEGYKNASSTKTITISGKKSDAPTIEAADETAVRYGSARFTLNTEGAEDAAVRYYTLGDTSSDFSKITVTGDVTTYEREFYNATVGTKYGFAFAVKRDGKWSAWSSSRIVTIVEQELLATPIIEVSEAVAGKDLVFTFSEVSNADSYHVEIYQGDRYIRSSSYSNSAEIVIPGYRVEPGLTYTCTVTVSDSTGVYGSNSSSKKVTAAGTRTDAPLVSVSKQEVLTDESFTFTITTDDAERIAMRRERNSSIDYYTHVVLDRESVWETSVYNAGDYVYCFAILKNGQWSAWSDPITLHTEKGESLQKPEITIQSGTVAGQDLVISVNEVEHAGSYYLYLYNGYDESVYSGSIDSMTRMITVPGYRLANGSYTAEISARPSSSSSGYVSSSATASFAITGSRPAAPDVSVQSTALNWSNYWTILFETESEGIEQLVCRSWIPGKTSLSYKTFEDLADLSVSLYAEEGSARNYSFSVYKDGQWSAWSDVMTVKFETE